MGGLQDVETLQGARASSVFIHRLRKLITAVEGHYPASHLKVSWTDNIHRIDDMDAQNLTFTCKDA